MSLFKRKGLFGKLVIGDQRAKEETKFIAERRHKFGPLVLGDRPPVGSTPAKDAQPVKAGMSLEQMAEVLKKNPVFVGALVEQEFARERDAIRPGALKLFIQHAEHAYEDPNKAKLVIGRCQRFLDKGADEDAGSLTKKHVAAGKKAGLKEVVNDPKNAKVKPQTRAIAEAQ